MSKPTPGPWKIWTGDVAVMIYQPDDDPHYRNNIANVFRNDPNGNAKRPWEANARLIAAAPELLNVLEQLCNAITAEREAHIAYVHSLESDHSHVWAAATEVCEDAEATVIIHQNTALALLRAARGQ